MQCVVTANRHTCVHMQIAWTDALLVDVSECCVDCVFGLPRFLLLLDGGGGVNSLHVYADVNACILVIAVLK